MSTNDLCHHKSPTVEAADICCSQLNKAATTKLPLPIEKIKKQEDEEQWISGEELYTEGSSDDEDKGSRTSCSRQTRTKKSKTLRPPSRSPRRPSPLAHSPPKTKQSEESIVQTDEASCCEEPIQWRPKRGSIKLPIFNAETKLIEVQSSDTQI